ncbi:MAG: helix-turn-helix domain-containing protein [Geminicoccaceae bacterium]
MSVADRDELNFLQPAGGGVFCLSLGHEVLDLVSATFFGAPWSAVAPAAPVLSVRDDGRLLAEFRRMQALATSVDPLRLADPIFSRRLELSAAESLMAQVTIGPLRPVPAAQRRRLAQRAEAFLRANEKRPVGIAELCAAVGAPERTLQLAFREYFGLPPIAYLRVRRLHHVRRQLLELGARTSVTATATDWGFDHLGEFSVAYRRLFGETPSQTLRR